MNLQLARILFVLCIITLPVVANAQESAELLKQYSLKDALQRGIIENLEIKVYEQEALATKNEAKEVRSALLPHIFFAADGNALENSGKKERNSDYLTQQSKTIRVGVEQRLLDAPAYFRYRSASARAQVSEASYNSKVLDIAFEIRKEFFLYLKAKENVKSYEKAIERLEKQLEAAEAFFARQMVPKLHVVQAKSELARALQDLSAAQNNVQIQKNNLAYLLNMQNEDSVLFVGDLLSFQVLRPFTLNECISVAMQKRPDIIRAQEEVNVLKEDILEAQSEYLPTVSASVQHIQNNTYYDLSTISDVDREYVSMGISMRLSLFEGGRSYFKVKKNKRRKHRAELALKDTKQLARTQVRSSFLNVQEAVKQTQLSQIYIDEASETYRRALKRYELGMGTNTELVDANSELINAELSLNQAWADYHIALSELMYTSGSIEKLLKAS